MFNPSVGATPLERTSLKALGHVVRRTDDATGLWWDEMLVYNATGGPLVANACYVIAYSGTEDQSPQVIVAAAVASVRRRLAVATEAAAAGAYTWVVIQGNYPVRCDGTTDIAAGEFLKLAPGTDADALIRDGAALTEASVAVAREAFTTNANGNVLCTVLPREAVINT